MRLTMVGTGYVGLVTGTCLANTGNHVTGLDIDAAKIQGLNQGKIPIYEPGLEEMIQHNAHAGRLRFTTDAAEAYQSAQVIFICVGTPSDEDGRADLSAVLAVARAIGEVIEASPHSAGGLEADDPTKIVVLKSTVPVGTNAQVRQAIAEKTAKPFLMASNPEFLKEGAAITDFNKPDRVVLGVDCDQTAERLRELYAPFVRQGHPIIVTDIPSAEMVKYASNTMLATKISFINEIAALCEAYGADIDQVRQGMCADRRIGNQFLYPGLGYGGSCFPKDVLACIGMGRDARTPARLLEAVDAVNQRQRARFCEKLDEHFHGDLSGKRLALWGLSFKPGTDDMREAPSITIIEHVLTRGGAVTAYDPVASEVARARFGDRIALTERPLDACDGAAALVVCTDWDEFKAPDFQEIKKRLASPAVFDGRNLYRPEMLRRLGFAYYSVGRQPVRPGE